MIASTLADFAKLAASLTGLQIAAQQMPDKMIDPVKKGKLEFRIISCRSVAQVSDEIRYDDDMTLHSVGHRLITIQVKFIGVDNDPRQDGLLYLERLGDRIVLPVNQAALAELGMALVSREQSIDLSKVLTADDRTTNIAVKDFKFYIIVDEIPADGPDQPASWIETVIFYSDELVGPDGTPTSIQISGSATRP